MIASDDLPEIMRRLRRIGSDDASTEVKSASGKLPKDVWATVSAFANTQGGSIILGLSEQDDFRPVADFNPSAILDAISAGLNVQPGQRSKVTPLPPTNVELVEFEDSVVVILSVDPLVATPAPCYVTDQGLENGSYRRWDDQNIHLNSYQIHLLRHRHDLFTTDRDPVPDAGLSDLDSDTLDRVVARLRAQRSRVLAGAENLPLQLQRLNVLTSDGHVTLAGLLSLATYPQQFYPQLFIDVAVHPGLEKSMAGTATRFLDRVMCEGPIPVMVEDAVSAVLRNLRTAHVVDAVGAEDVPEIPEDVLREALVNAVTHRDYSAEGRGQQVSVDIFPDRVEILSPGGLYGGVTPATIADGISRSRNDTLAKMLTRVPLPSGGTVCENQGSGAPRMIASMREKGLPLPEFKDQIDGLLVVLHRFDVRTQETRGTDTLDGLSAPAPRTPTEHAVWAALDSVEPRSINELAQITGRTPHSLRPILRRLITLGAVIATAPSTSRNRAYLRAEARTPPHTP